LELIFEFGVGPHTRVIDILLTLFERMFKNVSFEYLPVCSNIYTYTVQLLHIVYLWKYCVNF